MDIQNFLKKTGHLRIGNSDRAVISWVLVVSLTLVALVASIGFHTFFLLGVESYGANTPALSGSSAQQTIDRARLQNILSDHNVRIANFPSEKSAALASPDPSN